MRSPVQIALPEYHRWVMQCLGATHDLCASGDQREQLPKMHGELLQLADKDWLDGRATKCV